MQTDKNIEEQMLSSLGKQELDAIEMKYEGYNHKEIADSIKMSHQAVRNWFMNGGKLYDFYIAYAKEESKKRKAEAHDTFKAHLNNAVRVLVAVMNKSKLDVARVQAAKEIINRQLGEPVKTIAVTDETKVNEYLAAALLLSKQNENISTNDGRGTSPSTPSSE